MQTSFPPFFTMSCDTQATQPITITKPVPPYNYSHFFLLSTRNTCFIFTCPFRNLFTLILGSQFVINHLFLGIKIVFIEKKGSSMRSLIIRFIGRPNAISSCWDFYAGRHNEAAVLIRLITV